MHRVTNYPITFLCLLVVVVIVLDYAVINFPRMFLRSKTLNLGRFAWARAALSVALMVLVVLLDGAVPDLSDVFGLCGSLGLSVYCYTLPGLILLFAGTTKAQRAIGVVAVFTGLVMLFGGTFFILKKIIAGK